jgi:hypothetical protein
MWRKGDTVGTLEVIKIVSSAGAIGLLGLVLFGLYRLADKFIPPALAAYNRQTDAIAANTTATATLATKFDQVISAADDARQRASESAEGVAEMRGAAFATGQHAAITAERPPPPPASTRRHYP